MKKTLKIIIISGLIALMLLTNWALATNTTDVTDDAYSLEQRLIGTWRWENPLSSWIIIFREDGTMLDGPSFLRTSYNWQVVNGRLLVNGVDWNIRITDNTITVDRYGRNTHTYVWYSDSTEGETSLLLLGLIGIVMMIVIGTIVTIVLIRRNRRKKRKCNILNHQASNVQEGSSMRYITGKPPIALDVVLLVVNIIIDISLLLSGRFIWFFILLIFTILPAGRLIRTLSSEVVVYNRGVYGKIKKEQFQLGYHEISSVSIADKDDNKNLLIVSGYKSYSIRIKNARAVRDAITYNMSVLNVTPAPMPSPVLTTPAQEDQHHDFPSNPSDMLYVNNQKKESICIDDTFRERIIDIFNQGKKIDALFLFEDIPSEKLQSAMSSFAPTLKEGETVIFLYDDTARGNAKDGIILTTKHLYCKGAVAPVWNIERLERKGILNITVKMKTRGNITIAVAQSKRSMEALLNLSNQTIELLKLLWNE